ncbi:MAG: PAS domain-containing sensor histidine kinase [Bosea sp. (in: a-proteobacteria)]
MKTQPDILDLLHESVITRNASGSILYWNAASILLYGWQRSDAVGRNIDELLGTRHKDLPGLMVALLTDGLWEGELVRLTRAGEERVLDIRWIIERDTHGKVVRIIETARDMSHRKTTESALRESEYRYRNMFEAMAVAFWEVDFTEVGAMLVSLRDQGVRDLRGHLLADRAFVRATMERAMVLDLNQSGFALFGAPTRDAIIGKSISAFWPRDSEPVYIDALVATMTRQPHVISETRLNRIDGEPIDVLFTVSLSQDNRRRGIMLIGVVDISARKCAEAALQKMQAEFAHAARISMLGELTASIAHEVNQPLAAIAASGAASLRWLAAETPKLDEVRDLATRMVADAQRAASIIARIHAMAERREPERVAISMNSLVADVLTFLDHELKAQDISLDVQLEPDLPELMMDRTPMQQVIVNLAVNAMQAMVGNDRRRLTLVTSRLADGLVSLQVEDSGHGLPEEANRLFESFYTTKATGMGMGLAICRSIVEAHGGTILASQGDVGARFTVNLPV